MTSSPSAIQVEQLMFPKEQWFHTKTWFAFNLVPCTLLQKYFMMISTTHIYLYLMSLKDSYYTQSFQLEPLLYFLLEISKRWRKNWLSSNPPFSAVSQESSTDFSKPWKRISMNLQDIKNIWYKKPLRPSLKILDNIANILTRYGIILYSIKWKMSWEEESDLWLQAQHQRVQLSSISWKLLYVVLSLMDMVKLKPLVVQS